MSGLDIESLNLLLSGIGNFSTTIFWVRSADYKRQIYVSPSYENLYGNPCDQLYNHPTLWSSTIFSDERDSIIQRVKLRTENQIKNIDDFEPLFYRVQLPDSTNHFIKNRSYPIRDKEGNIIAFMGFSEGLPEQEWEILKGNQTKDQVILSDLKTNLTQLIQADLKHISPKEIIKAPPAIDKIHLSNREKECLRLLLQGNSAKQTARQLNLSPRTVEVYLDGIKQKFNCRTKIEVISKLQGQLHLLY